MLLRKLFCMPINMEFRKRQVALWSDAGYTVAINKNAKNFISQTFLHADKHGISKKTLVALWSDTGFTVAKSTLNDWIRRVKEGQDAVLVESYPTGRPSKFSYDQLCITLGKVLHYEEMNKILTLKSLRAFVRKKMDIEYTSEGLRLILP